MLMIRYLRNRDNFSFPGIRKIEDPETVMRWEQSTPFRFDFRKKGLLGLLCINQVDFGSLINEVMTLSMRYS